MALKRRRRIMNPKRNTNSDDWLETADMVRLIARFRHKKELKTEIRYLQLENKLNQQIRRLIDRQLDQLNDQITNKE